MPRVTGCVITACKSATSPDRLLRDIDTDRNNKPCDGDRDMVALPYPPVAVGFLNMFRCTLSSVVWENPALTKVCDQM